MYYRAKCESIYTECYFPIYQVHLISLIHSHQWQQSCHACPTGRVKKLNVLPKDTLTYGHQENPPDPQEVEWIQVPQKISLYKYLPYILGWHLSHLFLLDSFGAVTFPSECKSGWEFIECLWRALFTLPELSMTCMNHARMRIAEVHERALWIIFLRSKRSTKAETIGAFFRASWGLFRNLKGGWFDILCLFVSEKRYDRWDKWAMASFWFQKDLSFKPCTIIYKYFLKFH